MKNLRRWLAGLLLGLTVSADPVSTAGTTPPGGADDLPRVWVVVGAEGESEFGVRFRSQAAHWTNACFKAGVECRVLGVADPGAESDRDQLHRMIQAEPTNGIVPLWIVLIGHGTWDGHEAKFNLRGPDLSASELAQWLKPNSRPLAVINTAAASAPWIPALTGPRRVVITATRSGDEQNATRLGDALAEAIADPSGDLDQDGQTSLLEAFLKASARTAEWYQTSGRLATEHALIDDNGDGMGTPAAWFRGTRATRTAADGARLDGSVARQFVLLRSPLEQKMTATQRTRRDAVELELSRLRERRPASPNDAYYRKVEALALELARLQPQASP
jgi:hypothetical protein